MDLVPNEEQQQLRAAVRSWLDRNDCNDPIANVDLGSDREMWLRFTTELDALAIPIPVQYGGLGGGATDFAVVMEETGRVLFNSPLLATWLAAAVLLECATEDARARLLPRIAAGASATVTEVTARPPFGHAATARPDGGRWRLDGAMPVVLDGASAEIVLVVAEAEGHCAVFDVGRDAPGLAATAADCLDMSRELASVTVCDTPAERISASGDAAPGLERACDRVVSALAAEQVGGAQAVFDQAVGYAGTREQFGRLIGGFQAIKHKCADLLVEVEGARSAAYQANACADHDPDRLGLYSSLAKAVCSETYFRACRENIQIHGGIGFTWEHSAHLYYRRAKSSQLLFGSPEAHRSRIGHLLTL